jgi:effector-binding domain-containing protein
MLASTYFQTKENKIMSYNCELLERPAQPVLSIRTRAALQNLPQVLGPAYGAIAQYLGQKGQQPAGAPFVAYYNTDMQNLDMEIGFPVTGQIPGEGEIQANEIPGGKLLTCLHVGPYDKVGAAYEAMQQWLEVNAREAIGVAYEFYLNDPMATAPEALQTQIIFPLKAQVASVA